MRSAPSVSIRLAAGVSTHLARLPSCSDRSQPAWLVRISACRVAFSAMPMRAKTASTADVHAVPSPGSTSSPRTVSSRPRALDAPAWCRRDTVGASDATSDAT